MFVDPKKHLKQFLIGEGMKIIDLGSGVGHFALEVAKEVGKHGEVIAVDVLSDLLSKLVADAKSKGHHNIKVIHADLDSKKGSGIKKGYADRILLINTLFQLQERIKVLEEAKELLKKGGALVLIDWHPGKGSPWPDDQLISEVEAKKLLKKAGFEEVLEIELPHHHYGFIARKISSKSAIKHSDKKI